MKFVPTLMAVLTLNVAVAQRYITSFPAISATQAIGDKVFFTATHDLYGAELFVSDGISGNFNLLKDINPGYAGSGPTQFTVFNNQLFFIAYSPGPGMSLWKSDGTPAGTELVYGVENAEPNFLMLFKGQLYFTTNFGAIMRTDGTTNGTEVFFQSDYTWGRIMHVIKSDNYLYFSGDGRMIYRDDGSNRISFLAPLSWEDVSFRNLFILDEKLVAIKSSSYDQKIRFYAVDENQVYDGREDEWPLIRKIDAVQYGSHELENFTIVEGKLFFSLRADYNSPATDELWVSDGTEAGTRVIKSFTWDRHYYQSGMRMFFEFGGKLFFRNGNPEGRSLWISDGTDEGTFKFHSVILSPTTDDRNPVLIHNGKFYFSGENEYNNPELWISDGTSTGTYRLLDLEDEGGSSPHFLTGSNDIVYFATSQPFRSTLWSTLPAADISVTGEWGNPIKSGASPYLFNGIPTGSCKPADISVSNKGMGDLYLREILITGRDYYLERQTLPEKLAPGESVTIKVLFNPVREGSATATLTIRSSDIDEPHYLINLQSAPGNSGDPTPCLFDGDKYLKHLFHTGTTTPILLSNSTIVEGMPIGVVIGELSIPGNETTSTTFTLAPGEGDSDNQNFYIEDNFLKSNVVFNFNGRTFYSLRVKARSENGESESSFRISVVNNSLDFSDSNCKLAFERMDFGLKSLDVNQAGHLLTTTSDGRILRSMDGGETWGVVYYGAQMLSEITFRNNTGYATGNYSVLKSDDGGSTWFALYLPFTGQSYYSSPAIFFLNDLEGYVSNDEGEVLFTPDGGRTWETRRGLSGTEFRNLFFASKDVGYAIASFGYLLKTTDGGRSWSTIDLSSLGWNTRASDIWFTNENDGFLVTEYGFYITSDGGQTWREGPALYGDYWAQIKFINEREGFVFGGNGVIYNTSDKGLTWSERYPGVYPGRVSGVVKTGGKIYVTTQDYYYSNETRGIAVSSDEGATWSVLDNFQGGDQYYIDFSVGKRGFTIGEHGLFRTEDNGLTWKQTSMDIAGVADIHFIDENTLIALSGGHLYKSTDEGATTRKVLTTEQGEVYRPAGKLYGFGGDILFSVSWYAVYRSEDAGENWELVSTDPGYYTQGMHFVSPLVGYRIELFGSVEKSVDGGKTWQSTYTREPTSSNVFNAIYFLNENTGFAGGDYLQKTTDGGYTWNKLSWPFYEIIAIKFENKDHGYVVTRGGTVYETTNAGATFETIFAGSQRVFNVQFGESAIYLAGEDGFVARMNTAPTAPSMPGYIFGPASVCAGDAEAYHVSVNGQYNTHWSTTADNLEDHTGYVTIRFPDAGEFTISARHFNSCGVSEIRTTTVLVTEPLAPLIEGPTPVDMGKQDVDYAVTNDTGNSLYFWEVVGGSATTPSGNSVTVDWTNVEQGELKVFSVDASGCRANGSLVVQLEVQLAAEIDLGSLIDIYPNPAETEARIASVHTGPLVVRVLDLVGKEYLRLTLSPGEDRNIVTRWLPAGMYVVEISDGNRTDTKKLIIE